MGGLHLPLTARDPAATIAVRLGVGAVVRRATRGHLRVLAYHEVPDPDAFEAQLAYLHRAYQLVSLADVTASLGDGPPLPERAVLITFDDGHRSVLERGLPVLERYQAPAVLFVIAGLLGSSSLPWWLEGAALYRMGARMSGSFPDWKSLERRLKRVPNGVRLEALEALRASVGHPELSGENLTARDLRALERARVAIGNHTWSHPCLDYCDEDELEEEIERANGALAEVLGHAVRSFAFPNGNVDGRATTVLSRLGYEIAFAFDHSMEKLPIRSRFDVSRLRVSAAAGLDRLRVIVDGAHPLAHHALRRP